MNIPDLIEKIKEDLRVGKNPTKVTDYDRTTRKIIPIRNGLGDNIVFNVVISDLYYIYTPRKIIIGTAYPEVYEDNILVSTMDIYESAIYEDINKFNVYAYMYFHKWRKPLAEAYYEMLIAEENYCKSLL